MSGQFVRRVAHQTQIVNAVQSFGEGKIVYVVTCIHPCSLLDAKLGKSHDKARGFGRIISAIRFFVNIPSHVTVCVKNSRLTENPERLQNRRDGA